MKMFNSLSVELKSLLKKIIKLSTAKILAMPIKKTLYENQLID